MAATSKLCSLCFLFMLFIFNLALETPSNITYEQNRNKVTKPNNMHRSEDEVMALYNSWLIEHGKIYEDAAGGEKEKRFRIFKDNLRFIDEHNAQGLPYKLGLNQFADLTHEEFRSMYVGRRMGETTRLVEDNKISNRYAFQAGVGDVLPDAIDWRQRGAVGPIKFQGRSCGSCWAFATTGTVEAIHQIATGEFVSLSEQMLVDCSRIFNNGCRGGLPRYAYDFIIRNGGIVPEEDYPYIGTDTGTCHQYNNNARRVSIDGYENVPANDEMALKNAVAHQPVSVAMDSSSPVFVHYESGIFTAPCGTNRDHVAVIVGYGTENGLDYWLVRNSWGAGWGENGYFRIQRSVADPRGKCGIAMEGVYPTINGAPHNPPSPRPPSPPLPPPSPITPVETPTFCNNYYTCPGGTTCCCSRHFFYFCLDWGCCPSQYPVCNTLAGTCLMSQDNPMQVKAMKQSPATPIWTRSRHH